MAPNTIFRIASQTKAITSVAILSLMEEGKLTLTDPVSRYIPSFATTKVAVRNGDAVEHRAGEARDHHPRSADPHRRHFLRHRRDGRGDVRSQGTRPGGRLRLVHRRQGRADLRDDGAAGDAAVRGAAGRGVGVRLQHRRPRLRRREGQRHAARSVHQDAHHRAARHEGHAVLPAAGAARPARRGVHERAATARSCARRTARAARAPTSTVRARASPAAPACSRRRRTTRASSR